MTPPSANAKFTLAVLMAGLACRTTPGRQPRDAPRDAAQRKGVIPDSEVSINGVSPGDSDVRVRALLGKPDSVSPPRRGISDYIFQTAYYPDLEVEYADRTVAYVVCRTRRCSTRAGFTI